MNLLLFALLAAADPCSYFSEKDVRELFEIPAQTPVRTVRADSCGYLWMGLPPTGQELREALMKGRHVPPRANESISFRIEPQPNAVKVLEARYELLSKGYTSDRDGQQLKVRPQKLEWVPNVGEKAFWNESLTQLVAARKNEIFSVVIRKQMRPSDMVNAATTILQTALRK